MEYPLFLENTILIYQMRFFVRLQCIRWMHLVTFLLDMMLYVNKFFPMELRWFQRLLEIFLGNLHFLLLAEPCICRRPKFRRTSTRILLKKIVFKTNAE